jgi:hypothetical protein
VFDLFKAVVTAGILNSTPELVRELEKKVSGDLSLDIDYDEIEKKEKAAAEQKQQMEEEQAQMQAEAQAAGGTPAGGTPEQGASGVPGDQQASQKPQGPPAAGPGAGNTGLSGFGADIDTLVLAAQRLFLTDTPVDEGL